MIAILLNGEQHYLPAHSSIKGLIGDLGLRGKFAVELNQNIIPRNEYPSTLIHTDDVIEIVCAIGGG